MDVGWIWTENLRAFLTFVTPEMDESDWTAIAQGIQGTDSEAGPWFDYPIGNVVLAVACEPGADEMISVKLEGHGGETVALIAEIMRQCTVRLRN